MDAVVDEQQISSLLKGVDIPPRPTILLELDKELGKENPSTAELVRLISSDVALSGHLMQVANSPAFAGAAPLSSITQAVQFLGTRSIFSIVVSRLLQVALESKLEGRLERFWESSTLTANLCVEIAERLRCLPADIAYTFGLFHDCGIPLLMRRFPQTKSVLMQANAAEDGTFTQIEDRLLGTNHAVVGYFLARRWRLPADVAQAILHHHDYSVLLRASEFSHTMRAQIAVSVLAEHAIRLHTQGESENEWPKAAAAVCAFLGLSLGGVDDLIEDLRDYIH
ncbi:HDOD domain-containing protein [Azonexus sp.]|uniref:HDOD domain-containing protein n=1 Tax=Azonexus sp. TaxID=1872668 RepID=UPI0039E2BBC4